jgi:hypothetical protein
MHEKTRGKKILRYRITSKTRSRKRKSLAKRIRTYSFASGFKTSFAANCEAMDIRFSLLAPLGGLLARDFGGGGGRDTTGFRATSGSKHNSLDSSTLMTASTSSVFGGLDGIGLPPHGV